MVEKDPLSFDRLRIPAAMALAAVAFAGTKPGSAEAIPQSGSLSEKSANIEANPLVERTSKRLTSLVVELRQMAKTGNPAVQKKTINYLNKKAMMLGVSSRHYSPQAKRYQYDQFQAVILPGKNLPETSALLLGASKPDFHKGDYDIGLFMTHINKPISGYDLLENYPKVGPSGAALEYPVSVNTPTLSVGYHDAELEFDAFTSRAAKLVATAATKK